MMKIPFVEIPKTHVRIPKSQIHSGHHIKVITSSGKYKGWLGVRMGWDGTEGENKYGLFLLHSVAAFMSRNTNKYTMISKIFFNYFMVNKQLLTIEPCGRVGKSLVGIPFFVAVIVF